MTDREFRKLKRIELIEIIYQLQTELEEAQKELNDRRIRMENAGSIAEAAVELNRLMDTAQNTADQYIESVKAKAQEEKEQILEEAKAEADRIVEEAKAEAEKYGTITNIEDKNE